MSIAGIDCMVEHFWLLSACTLLGFEFAYPKLRCAMVIFYYYCLSKLYFFKSKLVENIVDFCPTFFLNRHL
jgi:hypothetical protein